MQKGIQTPQRLKTSWAQLNYSPEEWALFDTVDEKLNLHLCICLLIALPICLASGLICYFAPGPRVAMLALVVLALLAARVFWCVQFLATSENATWPATGETSLIASHFQGAGLAASPEIAHAWTLALRFLALVRERQVMALEAWLVEGEQRELIELRAFARGLRRDREAVDVALAEEWSQGRTEGQVNRLKYLKGLIYGRTGFALLRKPRAV